jgi:hypothetical protein
MSAGCYYASVWGQVFGATQILPTIVTSFLSLTVIITGGVVFFIYGLYLHAFQFGLWAFQLNFQYTRVNPICQLYQTYAFPSVEAFYAASVATMVIGFSFAFARVLGKFTKFIMKKKMLTIFYFRMDYVDVFVFFGIGSADNLGVFFIQCLVGSVVFLRAWCRGDTLIYCGPQTIHYTNHALFIDCLSV